MVLLRSVSKASSAANAARPTIASDEISVKAWLRPARIAPRAGCDDCVSAFPQHFQRRPRLRATPLDERISAAVGMVRRPPKIGSATNCASTPFVGCLKTKVYDHNLSARGDVLHKTLTRRNRQGSLPVDLFSTWWKYFLID